MVIATRVEQLNSCLTELEQIHTKQETSPKIMSLGRKAMFILNDLIIENPNDFNLRCIRMKLNSDWLFDNYSSVIDDAEFIINHPDYLQQKLVAYRWLLRANERIGNNTEKITILENKLIDIHIIFKDQYKKNTVLGETYYDLAKTYLKVGNETYAYSLLELSYEHNPYINYRNLYLGLYMLKTRQYNKAEKYLWAHFLWENHTSKNKMMKYGVLLSALYENNMLDNNPNLIALLYHIIRNNKSSFNCFVVGDFFKLYGEKLTEIAKKYPENSKIQAVLANSYFLDFSDYTIALSHYKNMLNGDDPFYQSHTSRIYSCLENGTENILSLEFAKAKDFNTKDLFSYYHVASEFYELYTQTHKKEYLKLAEHYVKYSYDIMNAYLKYNTGDAYCNSLQHFDFIASLYGRVMSTYASLSKDKEQKNTLLVCAASVYWDGFRYNYSLGNLNSALTSVLKAKNFELFNNYLQQLTTIEATYTISSDVLKTIYKACYKLTRIKDLKKVDIIYRSTKKMIEKQKVNDIDSIEVFVNMAFDFFTLSINQNKNLVFIFEEINDVLKIKNIKNIHKDIYGVFLYYVGFCYDLNQDTTNAKKWYSQAVLVLKEIKDDHFITFYNKAITAYNSIK